jgi:hypothetical protein
VFAKKGIISNGGTLADIEIKCTITGVAPLKDMNVLGGDMITFTGTNLPHQVKENDLTITFSNELATKCKPESSKSTSLKCKTEAFDKAADLAKEYTATFKINGVTVDISTFKFQIKGVNKIIKSITPASVSPVLRTRITIVLDSDFPNKLSSIDDLEVNVTSKSAPSDVKQVAVVEVDDSAKSFIIKF